MNIAKSKESMVIAAIALACAATFALSNSSAMSVIPDAHLAALVNVANGKGAAADKIDAGSVPVDEQARCEGSRMASVSAASASAV